MEGRHGAPLVLVGSFPRRIHDAGELQHFPQQLFAVRTFFSSPLQAWKTNLQNKILGIMQGNNEQNMNHFCRKVTLTPAAFAVPVAETL